MAGKIDRGPDRTQDKSKSGSPERPDRISKANIARIEAELQIARDNAQRLRKDLTMQIVLGKDPDLRSLKEIEARITNLETSLKDISRREVPGTASSPADDEFSGIGKKEGDRGSDIDMEMIRAMIKDDSDDDQEMGTADVDPFLDRSDEALSRERSYVQSLKDELHPKVRLQKIKAEMAGERTSRLQTPESVQRPMAKRRIIRTVRSKEVSRSGSRGDLREILKNALDRSAGGNHGVAVASLEEELGRFGREGDAFILNAMGHILVEMGDLESAVRRFRQAVRSAPSDAKAINNLGIVLWKQKRFEEAIRVVNQAIEVDPNYERAWYYLGRIFIDIDPPLLKEASIFLKRAIEIDPRYEKAREALAICMDRLRSK